MIGRSDKNVFSRLLCSRSCRGRDQVAQGQVVDHILDLLDVVLDPVRLPTQLVVLEIKKLKAGVDVLDKVADLDSKLMVAKGNRVDS